MSLYQENRDHFFPSNALKWGLVRSPPTVRMLPALSVTLPKPIYRGKEDLPTYLELVLLLHQKCTWQFKRRALLQREWSHFWTKQLPSGTSLLFSHSRRRSASLISRWFEGSQSHYSVGWNLNFHKNKKLSLIGGEHYQLDNEQYWAEAVHSTN